MNTKLLSEICRIPGAPGYETPIRNFVLQEVKDLVDENYIDAMGNLIAIKRGASDKKCAIAAHIDEISFIVKHVDDEGFIRFHTLGGFDPKTLTAQRVIIHGKEDVMGVMGCKPIHIMSPEERSKAPKIADYFIDTGMHKDKVKELIQVGDVITRERALIEMGDCVNSKSLDNRVSVFILLEALRALKDKTPSCDIYALFTVQEEVGLRGAITASQQVDPDYGINLDVTIANDIPGAQAHEYISKLGAGVAIKILDGRTICDHRMITFMKQTADNAKIPWQAEVLTGGGTDTAALQKSGRRGSIAGALSIPSRYIHQHIEMCHKDDIQGCIDLLIACCMEVDHYDWSF